MVTLWVALLALLGQPDVSVLEARCFAADDPDLGRVLQFEAIVDGQGSVGAHTFRVTIEEPEIIVYDQTVDGYGFIAEPAVLFPNALTWGEEYTVRVEVDADDWLNETSEENNALEVVCANDPGWR